MKTRWILAGVLTLALSLPTIANSVVLPDFIFRTSAEELEKKLDIQLINLQQENTQIILRKMKGAVVFRETVRKHNGYQIRLDLSGLEDGRYVLQVEQDGTFKSQVISLHSGGILLSHIK